MQDVVDWLSGFAHGDQLQAVIVAVVLVAITAIVAKLASSLIERILSVDGVPLPSSSILVNVVRAVIWIVGLSIMLSACFNVDVHGLVAALGVGGIALSLGLQDTVKNFIGGLQVTVMKIVQPGDHIVVGGTDGIVQDVSWRQTVVKDYENNVHLIPNAVINSAEVTKVEPSCLVASTVVLNNDGREVDELLREMERLASEALADVPDVQVEKAPWFLVTQIGEYGIWAKMRFVLADIDHAREARDAALRAIAPYTRNNSQDILGQ